MRYQAALLPAFAFGAPTNTSGERLGAGGGFFGADVVFGSLRVVGWEIFELPALEMVMSGLL